MQGLSGRELAIKRAARERLVHAREVRKQQLDRVSEIAGRRPASLEDARELNARALGEILLKPQSLRRFEKLLWSKEDRIAKEMFALAFNHILSTATPATGEQKPTQVIVNNLVARPEHPTADKTTVEIR
jgi:hypothetical protein